MSVNVAPPTQDEWKAWADRQIDAFKALEERCLRAEAELRAARAREAEALRLAANRVADLELTQQEVDQLIDSDEASVDWCDGWDAAVQQAEIAVLLPPTKSPSPTTTKEPDE